MRKTFAVIGAAAVMAVATVWSSGAAQAMPNEKFAEEWNCEGEDVIIVAPGGRVGWIDGVKYLAVELSFTTTFTPTSGEPQEESFTKTYANGKGADSPDAVFCTVHFEETTPEGTLVEDGSVTVVPVH